MRVWRPLEYEHHPRPLGDLEFIARVVSHILDRGEVMVRTYGLNANAHRGKVRKASRRMSTSCRQPGGIMLFVKGGVDHERDVGAEDHSGCVTTAVTLEGISPAL